MIKIAKTKSEHDAHAANDAREDVIQYKVADQFGTYTSIRLRDGGELCSFTPGDGTGPEYWVEHD